MTPSRKTWLCMTLLIVCAAARDGALAPAYGQPVTTAEDSVDPAAPSAGLAVATNAPMASAVRYSSGFFYQPGDNRLTEPALVVPAKELDAETVGRIVADLTIMSRIIEKNAVSAFVSVDDTSTPLLGLIRPDRMNTGPEVLFSSAGRPKPFYIAGYGAVFFIQVGFPLLPPPETEDKPPAEEPTDTVWAQTRQSLFEPRAQGLLPGADAAAPEPYSRLRVNALKDMLITTMKHAANIRALEPRERLTIVVQGTSPRTDASTQGEAPGRAGAPAGRMPSGTSVLTLRASKADVDLFAKGQLNQGQFETLSSLVDIVDSTNDQRLWEQAGQAVFVVPAPDLPADGLTAVSEDMVVMCRIFDKATGPARRTVAIGGQFDPYGGYAYGGRTLDGGSRTQGLYLDGYGALFFVEVSFPLAAVPQEQEQPKTEQSADPLWRQTVEELQGSPQKQAEAAAQEYDAQKVENLKSVLIKSLRHAANLRVRGPQDVIAVVIRVQNGSAVADIYGDRWSEAMMSRSPASGSSDVLVLRTTKADVDAFAKGDVPPEQFAGKVQVLRSWTHSAPQAGSATTVGARGTGRRGRR